MGPKSFFEIGYSRTELNRLVQFEDIFKTAINEAEGRLHLMEVLRKVRTPKEKLELQPESGGDDENAIAYRKQKENAERLAEIAGAELRDEFPYLHALFVVRMCTIIEAAVEDAVCKALQSPNIWTQPEVIARVTGPLLPFAALSDQERAEYLFDELLKVTNARRQVGVGRFEVLLDPVGMGGGVLDGVRKGMLELYETRHLIVHRDGRIDKQFQQRVPWRAEAIGSLLKINERRFYISWLLPLGMRRNWRNVNAIEG